MSEEIFENVNSNSESNPETISEPVTEIVSNNADESVSTKKKDIKTFLNSIKNFIKKRLALVITIPVVLCCILSIVLIVFFNTPKVVVGNAILGVFEGIASRPEFNTVANAMKSGSIEASMTGLAIDGKEMNTDTSISGKLYFAKNALMLEDLNIESDGFNLSGSLYADTTTLYVKEDEIFDKEFGFNVDDLGKDIEDSIFAYGSGSKYAFTDEEEYNRLINAFSTSKIEDFQKDAKKLAEKYYTKIYDIAAKHAVFESKNDKIKVNGERLNARVITIEIDEKAMSKIARETCEYLINDKSVIKFLEKYEDRLMFILSESSLIDSDEDSIVDLYEDWLDDLENEIDDICESIEDDKKFEIKIKVVTETMSSDLLKLSVEAYDDNIFTLELGPGGIKKTDKITLNIDGTEMAYTVKKNNDKKYSANFTVDDQQIFEVEVNKSREEFTLIFGDEKDLTTIEGDIVKKSKTTTISIDKITTKKYYYDYYYDYEEYETHVYEPELEIIIKESDKMPKIPKDYSTISDITEEDMDKLLGKFNIFN